MIELLETSITPVPSGRGLTGPAMMVVPAGEGASTADLYRRYSAAPASCRAHERSVAIVSTGELNTPDKVGATGGRRDSDSFQINLDIRRFDGPMAANDPWLALVRMELGSLEQGSYQLIVQETVRRFTDIAHPETATDPTETERSFSFTCA